MKMHIACLFEECRGEGSQVFLNQTIMHHERNVWNNINKFKNGSNTLIDWNVWSENLAFEINVMSPQNHFQTKIEPGWVRFTVEYFNELTKHRIALASEASFLLSGGRHSFLNIPFHLSLKGRENALERQSKWCSIPAQKQQDGKRADSCDCWKGLAIWNVCFASAHSFPTSALPPTSCFFAHLPKWSRFLQLIPNAVHRILNAIYTAQQPFNHFQICPLLYLFLFLSFLGLCRHLFLAWVESNYLGLFFIFPLSGKIIRMKENRAERIFPHSWAGIPFHWVLFWDGLVSLFNLFLSFSLFIIQVFILEKCRKYIKALRKKKSNCPPIIPSTTVKNC